MIEAITAVIADLLAGGGIRLENLLIPFYREWTVLPDKIPQRRDSTNLAK